MTLTRFVTKNAFRNKRRSALTVLSIAFSLLLLTLINYTIPTNAWFVGPLCVGAAAYALWTRDPRELYRAIDI